MVRSNIEVVRAEGDFQRNIIISFLDYRVEWSLAGNKILFVSNRDGNNEIYSMNADGSDQLRLTYNPADDHSPVWSPR
jgi:TolB protein